MRVVDIVIGVGWVIFWVGWFAASAGASGDSGDGATGRASRASGGAHPGRRAPGPAAGAGGAWRRIRQRPGPVGRRPRHLGPGPGTGRLGADIPRPELGNADVHEGRPRAGHIRPVPDDRHPIYTGILLAMIGLGDRRQRLVADRRGTDRVLHLQRLRGGAQYDQALPQCLSGVPAVHENADPLYLLRTARRVLADGPRPRCWPRGLLLRLRDA